MSPRFEREFALSESNEGEHFFFLESDGLRTEQASSAVPSIIPASSNLRRVFQGVLASMRLWDWGLPNQR